jgi:hypothetical protein
VQGSDIQKFHCYAHQSQKRKKHSQPGSALALYHRVSSINVVALFVSLSYLNIIQTSSTALVV